MKFAKSVPTGVEFYNKEHLSATLSKDMQNILHPYCNVDMSTHIPVHLLVDFDYASAGTAFGHRLESCTA